jgi:hypothetical protein
MESLFPDTGLLNLLPTWANCVLAAIAGALCAFCLNHLVNRNRDKG